MKLLGGMTIASRGHGDAPHFQPALFSKPLLHLYAFQPFFVSFCFSANLLAGLAPPPFGDGPFLHSAGAGQQPC